MFFSQLLNLFGCTEQVHPFAVDYGRIILIGLPFSMISTGLASIIRADGSPRYSMVCTLAGAVLNIVLDPIAIFVLELGVKDAAYATIIGQIVSFVAALLYLPRMKTIRLQWTDIRPGKKMFTIMGYGISSFFTQITVVIMSTVMNRYLSQYGAGTVYGADIPLSIFPLLSILALIFGFEGILWTEPVADVLAFVIASCLFTFTCRRELSS